MNNMFDELKAWAEKWNVPHKVQEDDDWGAIYFESVTYYDATLDYHKKTGDYTWYGGD